MDRRQLLLGSLAASIALRARALGSESQQQQPPAQNIKARHAGPYFLFVELAGGWDATQVCDPKDPRISGSDPSKARRIGPFAITDHSHWGGPNPAENSQAVLNFFQEFQNDILQLDGVKSSVSTHEFGRLELNMGTARSTTYPNVLAAIAASLAPDVPLPYLTNSGYASTAGLVQSVPMYDMSRIRQLLNPTAQAGVLGPGMWAKVMAQLDNRLAARAQASGLNHAKSFYANMGAAHRSAGELAELDALMNDLIAQGADERFAFTIAAFELGLSVTSHITFGGFDTHDNHFERHHIAVGDAFRSMTAGLRLLKQRGLLSKTTVLIGSEFGRTAFYGKSWDTALALNATQGKDHGLHSTVLLLGRGITGNQRLGSTGERLVSERINFGTLQLDPKGHILGLPALHQALRTFAGVKPSIADRFPLRVNRVPKIFG